MSDEALELLKLHKCRACNRKYVDGNHLGQDTAPAQGNLERHMFRPDIPTLSDIFGRPIT